MDIIPSDQIKLDKENVLKDKEEEKTKKEAAEDLFSAHDFDITIGMYLSSLSRPSSPNSIAGPMTCWLACLKCSHGLTHTRGQTTC